MTKLEIAVALDSPSIEIARELFLEYQRALGVDLCFQGFAAELAALPGAYAAPQGRLLIARSGGSVIGCVALRPLTREQCEMKRLYIRPGNRGSGFGRQLVERVIEEARAIGYSRMCLDTLPTMTEAQHLYEQLGFRDAVPYTHNPIVGTRYLALDLV
jgi:GNAT superfamily N-acetyltransferase